MYYDSIGIVLKIEYLLYIEQHPTFYKSTSACRSWTSVYVLKSKVTLSCNVVTMLYLPRWNEQLIWPCSFEVRCNNIKHLHLNNRIKSALHLTQFYYISLYMNKNFTIIEEKCKKIDFKEESWRILVLQWNQFNNADFRSMTIDFVTNQRLCCPNITNTSNPMHLL